MKSKKAVWAVLIALLVTLFVGAYAEEPAPAPEQSIEEPAPVEQPVEEPTEAPVEATPEPTPEVTPEPQPEATATPKPIYTVRFLDWNDDVLYEMQLEEGMPIELPPQEELDPAWDGYIFLYWYEAEGIAEPYAYGEPLMKDLNLKAHFTKIPSTEYSGMYTVEFVNWDSTLLYAEAVEEGEVVEVPDFLNPSMEGYEFLYWYNEENGAIPFSFGSPTMQDLTLRAYFALKEAEQETQTYTIRYLNWDDTILIMVKLDEGMTIQEPTFLDPTRNGYVFAYWYDETADAVTPYQFGQEAAQNMSLKAHFTKVPTSERRVNVLSDLSGSIEEGDPVTLTGELIGFDDLDVAVQWQYNDGSGWHDVDNGSDMQYTFTATHETVTYAWRLAVTVNE